MNKNLIEIQHLTAAEFKAAPFEKVILPLGSLESHGPHLPFGTDSLTPYLIALEVAKRLPRTAVLPPVNYGVSEHYKAFPFTVSLQFDTMTGILRDILESLHREGIRKVFILNGHDGNIAPIEIAARTTKVAHPEMKIATMDAWWNVVGALLGPGFFEVWNGLGHGGEGETSICLALFPELCDPSKAAGVVPHLPPYIDIKWNFDELTNTGATGDPTKGSRDKGLKMKKALEDVLVSALTDLDKSDWDYRSPEVKGH
jgi:creatinine amidohydrolase